MKYYSEFMNKVFDTPEALNEAELKSKTRDEEIMEARKAKENAYKAYKDAANKYAQAVGKYDALAKNRDMERIKEIRDGKIACDEDTPFDFLSILL